MKPKYKRLTVILLGFASVSIGVAMLFSVFREHIVYFYSPSELKNIPVAKLVRIGGLVKKDSVRSVNNDWGFIVTDGNNDIKVKYHGIPPYLFREGQGVIAEGKLEGSEFMANTLLTKHDENYMPPEVVDLLKKSGHWKDAH